MDDKFKLPNIPIIHVPPNRRVATKSILKSSSQVTKSSGQPTKNSLANSSPVKKSQASPTKQVVKTSANPASAAPPQNAQSIPVNLTPPLNRLCPSCSAIMVQYLRPLQEYVNVVLSLTQLSGTDKPQTTKTVPEILSSVKQAGSGGSQNDANNNSGFPSMVDQRNLSTQAHQVTNANYALPQGNVNQGAAPFQQHPQHSQHQQNQQQQNPQYQPGHQPHQQQGQQYQQQNQQYQQQSPQYQQQNQQYQQQSQQNQQQNQQFQQHHQQESPAESRNVHYSNQGQTYAQVAGATGGAQYQHQHASNQPTQHYQTHNQAPPVQENHQQHSANNSGEPTRADSHDSGSQVSPIEHADQGDKAQPAPASLSQPLSEQHQDQFIEIPNVDNYEESSSYVFSGLDIDSDDTPYAFVTLAYSNISAVNAIILANSLILTSQRSVIKDGQRIKIPFVIILGGAIDPNLVTVINTVFDEVRITFLIYSS